MAHTEAGMDDRGAGRPMRRGGRFEHTYAALDLGTNNCRLLVARPVDDGFRVIDAFSRIVRLGEGLARSGRLSEPAMARTIEALRICAAKLDRRGVTRLRAVATEACRKAANCADFVARAAAATGLALEIITAAEEARLALAGCAPLLDYDNRHALVFDIGGGSTELMWLRLEDRRPPHLLGWLSIPLGVVTLAERHGGIHVDDAIFERMVAEVAAELAPFEARHGLRRHLADRAVQMLGTSGTVTTVAGVHLDLARYDRSQVDGIWLDAGDIVAVTGRLAAMDYDQRAAHGCIGVDRADLVIAGCAILAAIMRAWPLARLRVADRGVREGVLFDLMREADGDFLAAGE
ncbi:MAG TPA: Ppx/GppA phosphatase family protein [Candidatus Sulfotelmatobacter sp.]|nr:Ppx/GppA phosphatase family protein [Candidatus Sulfotelmatobacter sp.]